MLSPQKFLGNSNYSYPAGFKKEVTVTSAKEVHADDDTVLYVYDGSKSVGVINCSRQEFWASQISNSAFFFDDAQKCMAIADEAINLKGGSKKLEFELNPSGQGIDSVKLVSRSAN